ncbi:Myb-like protein J [Phytophthora citrophthora]|uniref:Myb-like protein J n=1 Tax=Phytophthora citrophthora TaxID=4793 RepID=A0AAD9G9C6_9STRA|nr:Myb-like protein J [Phytophthora citrophthora]
MAISDQVRSQLFQTAASPNDTSAADAKAIRIPTTRGGATRGGLVPRSPGSGRGLWTPEEHLRFLEALDKFPSGPWKCIAKYVGNKTARQAMTHGQKYRQKIARRRRGLKKIVRDLQFAAVDVNDNHDEQQEEAVTSSVTVLSDQDFAAFVSSLDLAEELQLDAVHAAPLSDSPLVVPNATAAIEPDMASFSLGDVEVGVPAPPASVTSDSGLPTTTTQQDVHHWVIMNRADASSEEFGTALAEAFNASYVEAEAYAFARPLPLPEQILDEYVHEQMSLEPLLEADPAFEGLESFQFDDFELR